MWPLLMWWLFCHLNTFDKLIFSVVKSSWHLQTNELIAFPTMKVVWTFKCFSLNCSFTKPRGRLQVSSLSVVVSRGVSAPTAVVQHFVQTLAPLSRLIRGGPAQKNTRSVPKTSTERHRVSAETLERPRLSLVRYSREYLDAVSWHSNIKRMWSCQESANTLQAK